LKYDTINLYAPNPERLQMSKKLMDGGASNGMSTIRTPRVDRNSRDFDNSAEQPKPKVRTLLNDRHGLSAGVTEQASLPALGTVLARPVLLSICVILGALAGFAAPDSRGYQATSTIEFFTGAGSVELVGLEGHTLAHRTKAESVIQRAATSTGQSATEIGANTTAKWKPESSLVDVTAVAASRDAAIARANAVATAVVADVRDSVNERLGAATSEANSLLREQSSLADPEAEVARRSEVGASLGQRQEGLKGQSESVFVARTADEATPTGLTKSMGIAIGMAVGLFAGCLIAVLLGTRGLRASSRGALRRLVPGVEVMTPSQAPQLAGRIVEADENFLAVVATPGSSVAAKEFADEIEHILSIHGKTVSMIHPAAELDEASAPLLRADGPSVAQSKVGIDVLLVIVEAGTESAAMLEGRSGFSTVIVMRRRRTPVSAGLWAAQAYARATPVLMLAK
jgi:hypothetical protein